MFKSDLIPSDVTTARVQKVFNLTAKNNFFPHKKKKKLKNSIAKLK